MNSSQELNTDRLILREMKKSDSEFIFRLRSDESVNKFIKRERMKFKHEADQFIDMIIAGTKENKWKSWIITLKSDLNMIGSICLWNFSADRKTAEIGYDLLPSFQGNGYMNESTKSVIQYGFEVLKLESIDAFTNKKNIKSISLLNKNGFKLNESRIDDDNIENNIYELHNYVS